MTEGGAASAKKLQATEFDAIARTEELKAAQFSEKIAAQNVASAEAALGLLRNDKSGGTILDVIAPIAGEVLQIPRKDSGLVVAGTALVEIGDTASLEVVADFLTRDAVAIKPGAQASIVRWGGSRELSAHVIRVERSAFTRVSALGVEEQRVAVVLGIDAPRSDWQVLGDGFRVEVEIVVWHGDSVQTVPSSAIFRHQTGWAVYTVDDGTASLTPVSIGHRTPTHTEILSGLSDEATVIVHPGSDVVDDVSVEPRRTRSFE